VPAQTSIHLGIDPHVGASSIFYLAGFRLQRCAFPSRGSRELWTASPISKDVLQPELNHARIHAGGRQSPEVRRVLVGQRAGEQRGVWRVELRVIEQITEFRAELVIAALKSKNP
jgi:hypothetical protein